MAGSAAKIPPTFIKLIYGKFIVNRDRSFSQKTTTMLKFCIGAHV